MVKEQKNSSRTAIPLFWWSESRLMGKINENYGDLLSKYLVEKISGKPVKWVHPKKQPWYTWNKGNYLAVGSIIHHASRDSIVWGSGIIDQRQQIAPADFKAVRGPRTRKYLIDRGHFCPKIYGDPALLLPLYFNPEVKKKYEIGIIPHYHDYREVLATYQNQPEISVINMMTLDVEEVTCKILECESTISSSLHGLIVSHAFDISSVWVEFSDKLFGDGIKFLDYLESAKLPIYQPLSLRGKKTIEELRDILDMSPNQPDRSVLADLKNSLLEASPF